MIIILYYQWSWSLKSLSLQLHSHNQDLLFFYHQALAAGPENLHAVKAELDS